MQAADKEEEANKYRPTSEDPNGVGPSVDPSRVVPLLGLCGLGGTANVVATSSDKSKNGSFDFIGTKEEVSANRENNDEEAGVVAGGEEGKEE